MSFVARENLTLGLRYHTFPTDTHHCGIFRRTQPQIVAYWSKYLNSFLIETSQLKLYPRLKEAMPEQGEQSPITGVRPRNTETTGPYCSLHSADLVHGSTVGISCLLPIRDRSAGPGGITPFLINHYITQRTAPIITMTSNAPDECGPND